ncbi:MAG: amidohydrolase family protein, partial [Gemmatimonadales bacterium]
LARRYTSVDAIYCGMDSETYVEPLDRSLVLETLKIFNEEQVDVVIGTDLLGPLEIVGLSAFDEMDLFVEAGLKPYDALRAATITPAKVLGQLEHSGTIAVGKDADFVLVDGNPLENLDVLRKPSGVMAQGRWFDRDELRYLLAEAIESVTWCRDRC